MNRFLEDERGATAVELGMLVALISLALIGILTNLSGTLKTTFTKAGDALLGGS